MSQNKPILPELASIGVFHHSNLETETVWLSSLGNIRLLVRKPSASTFQDFSICPESSRIPAASVDSSLTLLNPVFSNLTSSKSPFTAVDQQCSGPGQHRCGTVPGEFIEIIAFLMIRTCC